jgi:hypothetical protein
MHLKTTWLCCWLLSWLVEIVGVGGYIINVLGLYQEELESKH